MNKRQLPFLLLILFFSLSQVHVVHAQDSTTDKVKLEGVTIEPNPYYAYSSYDEEPAPIQIEVHNLPAGSEITIYKVNGDMVRELIQENAGPTVWDLKNEKKIPIASGVYIFHCVAPNGAEAVLKFFGALRNDDWSF